MIYFKLRTNTITFKTRHLSTMTYRRRAMLCLMLVFLRRLRRNISTLGMKYPFPRRLTLLINRFVVKDRSKRINFLNSICRRVPPFTRLFTPPTCCDTVVSKWKTIKCRRVLISTSSFPRSLTYKTYASKEIRKRRLIIQFFRNSTIYFRLNTRAVRTNAPIKLMRARRTNAISFVRNYFNQINRTTSKVLF